MENKKMLIPVALLALLVPAVTFLLIFRSCTSQGTEGQTAKTVSAALESIAGQYEVTAMVIDGEETPSEDLALLKDKGITCTITLKSNGTGVLNLYGEESHLTWDDKTISTDKKSMSYACEGSQLIITDSDSSLTFSRTN